jgi:hypothetical protein
MQAENVVTANNLSDIITVLHGRVEVDFDVLNVFFYVSQMQ